MYGAILGDIVGSPYEFDCNNYKAKDFPLFSRRSDFTDDTVMTLAVVKALLSTRGQDDAAIKAALVHEMQQLGRAYPDRGYGTHFGGWLYEDAPQPYRSYGNGSAMRVSSAAWLAKNMVETLRLARLTAEVTHDHPEGIKGAQATAAAIFLARTGHGKEEIKAYVEREFGYDLSRTCDEIRPTYYHVESCQETVPQAVTAFLESCDFEDALRTAVSLGGDSDTLAAITGSIAEAFYGVPEELRQECRKRLTPELAEILHRWESAHGPAEGIRRQTLDRMGSTSFKTAKKQRGMCLNGTYPFCQQPLSGNCHIICFMKPVLWTAASGGAFCLWFLALDGVGTAGGVELAADRREHALGHIEIAPDLDLVDLKRQVGGVARFDVQIVERRALIEVLREAVRVEPDGLTAQIGEVVAVEVPARAVEQITLESLFDGLLTVEGDIVGVASVGQQQARALQVAQRLVEPFVVKMAV